MGPLPGMLGLWGEGEVICSGREKFGVILEPGSGVVAWWLNGKGLASAVIPYG